MIDSDEKVKINKEVEELFSKQINVDFLKNMLWKVLKEHPVLYDCYHFANKNLIEILPSANIYNVVCQQIIGIHKSKTFDLNNEEINQIEKDINYQNYLVEKAYQMIKTRYPQSESFFLREPLIQNYKYSNGSPIIYYPYLFFITTICLKIINSDFSEYHKNVFYKTLAFLSLLRDGFVDQAIAQLRIVLEECFYEILYLIHPEVYEEKNKFYAYNLENEEFLQKFKVGQTKCHNLKDTKKSKYKYLNYGWLDKNLDYVDKVKKYDKDTNNTDGTFPYSFEAISNYLLVELNNTYDSNKNKENHLMLNTVKRIMDGKFFDLCSNSIHSKFNIPNLYSKLEGPNEFKMIYYMIWVSLYLVKIIYEYICKLYDENLSINDIDVIKFIDEEIVECLAKCKVVEIN